MSTDSTELTFVRCPSCRSLVPAVSTRCRMCGAAIDAQGKQSSEPEAPRRTRSNTMSQPHTEFVDAAQVVRAAEGVSRPGVIQAEAPVASSGEDEEFDPLKEYMDEGAQMEAQEPPVAPTKLEPAPAIKTKQVEREPVAVESDPVEMRNEDVEDDFDIFGSDDDDWLDDSPVEKPVAVEKTERQPVSEPPRAAEPHVNGGHHQAEKVAVKEQPKVVIESGARSAGKPSALSFGKGRGEDSSAKKAPGPEPRKEKVNNPGREPGRPTLPPGPSQNFGQREKGGEERRSEPTRPVEPRKETQTQKAAQPQRPTQRPEPRPEMRTESRSEQREEPRSEQRVEPRREVPRENRENVERERPRAPVQEGLESRLVGWFVSFSTPTRSSLELREGKFFVSGASLKPNDIVLEDPSIATPHAMVTVEPGRMMIQDLMSETGVYLRRRGNEDFKEMGELFEVKHGDWIRFGMVDFLVTMIPVEENR